MTLAVLAGALFGGAVLVLIRAVSGSRPNLAAQLAVVDRAATRHPAASTRRGWAGLEQRLRTRLGGGAVARRLTESGLRADLNVLGIDETGYTARKVMTATATLLLGSLALSALVAAAGLPWPVGAWVAVLAAVAVFVAPAQRVRKAAAARRRDFLATLTAYLDLVAMRAASGSGVAEALRDAAGVGSGYGWRRLRAALEDARLAGRPPAAGLATLGAEIEVAEVTELAAQLALVDATGAQTEATLRAKAEALRGRQLADLHGDANARSQTMVVGQVVLAVGFLVLIGYPALAAVLAM